MTISQSNRRVMRPSPATKSLSRLSRRGVVAGALLGGSLWALQRANSAQADGEVVLFEGAQAVPADFVAQHFHAPLATPGYRVPVWRSHDGPSMQWRDAHPERDRFDWSSHDAAIAHYARLGMACNYCLYGTPTWASTQAWRPDPYNHFGGSSPPANVEDAARFVRELLTRYRGRIRHLEIWNEFNNTAGAVFWRGTLPDLARLARAVYRTAKEVDPSVIVLAPSVTSDDQSLTRYLRSEDGAGGRASRWLDAVAVHPYRGYGWQDRRHGPDLELGRWHAELTARMAEGGLPATTPIYATEIGYHWAKDDPTITGTRPVEFANWIDQVVLRAATLGIRQIGLYSHTSMLIGDPSTNEVVAQAIDRLATQLAGTTLRKVSRTAEGQYRARTERGELLLGGRR